MKKKYNNYRKAVVIVFLLTIAFGVYPLVGNMQENNPPIYAIVSCPKVKPENAGRYVELEKTIFKPLHLASEYWLNRSCGKWLIKHLPAIPFAKFMLSLKVNV